MLKVNDYGDLGSNAVQFFFIVSGFLVANRYWSEWQSDGFIVRKALEYIWRKVKMLWPLHLALFKFGCPRGIRQFRLEFVPKKGCEIGQTYPKIESLIIKGDEIDLTQLSKAYYAPSKRPSFDYIIKK